MNNPRSKIAVASLAIALCHGVAFATCYEEVDKFKGNADYWCGAWGTNGSMLGGLSGVDPIPYLSIMDGKTEVWLKLVIDQDRPAHIKAGSQLIFLLKSGDKISLAAQSDSVANAATESAPGTYDKVRATLDFFANGNAARSSKDPEPKIASEYAKYPITLEQLNTLANAGEVDFAVYADNQRIERKLGKSQLGIYKEFVEKATHLQEKTEPSATKP